MDKFDQLFFQYILAAKLYLKPTNSSYFIASVTHNPDVWKDHHEKTLGGWVLGITNVGSK